VPGRGQQARAWRTQLMSKSRQRDVLA
jgi:hypothetical protein